MKKTILFTIISALSTLLNAQPSLPVISTQMTGVAEVYSFVQVTDEDSGELCTALKPSGTKINKGETFQVYGIYSVKQDVEIGTKPSDLEQRSKSYQWVLITPGTITDSSKFIKFILARNSFLNSKEKDKWDAYLIKFDELNAR